MRYYKLLTFTLLLCLSTCGRKEKDTDTTQNSIETVLPDKANGVTITTLKQTGFNRELISNGKLSARRLVNLQFRSAEPIARIYVKNEDRVNKGQEIAELATFRLTNKTVQAKDTLREAKPELKDVLIGQGRILEDSAKVPPVTLNLARVRNGYDLAFAQYQLAQYGEQNTTLIAPFDGIVANLFAKQENVAPTTDAFCTVIDPHSLEASFAVLENELPLVQDGDKVKVTPFATTSSETEGHMSEINPLMDEDGMVQVKAAISDKGKLSGGTNVRVSVQRSLEKWLVVPKTAVVLHSGKQVIFALADGHTYRNYMRAGLENTDSYTLLERLKEGDVVITSGNVNLAHESPVKIIGNWELGVGN